LSYDDVVSKECLMTLKFRLMLFNATFNNISLISWRSVLLEETGVSKETTDLSKSLANLYHIML
jgi:hypothetical protein